VPVLVVRVAGGIYPDDSLYDEADRLGLLVWDEFKFAVAMYPRDEPFLHLVRREVAYQVRRLSSHASLLLFGGNNENESAMRWFPSAARERDVYLVDYVKLMLDTVRDQLLLEAPGVMPFVASSPTRGPLSQHPFTQRWGEATSNDYGDIHFYDVSPTMTGHAQQAASHGATRRMCVSGVLTGSSV
jgi:beta-mannosidase